MHTWGCKCQFWMMRILASSYVTWIITQMWCESTYLVASLQLQHCGMRIKKQHQPSRPTGRPKDRPTRWEKPAESRVPNVLWQTNSIWQWIDRPILFSIKPNWPHRLITQKSEEEDLHSIMMSRSIAISSSPFLFFFFFSVAGAFLFVACSLFV